MSFQSLVPVIRLGALGDSIVLTPLLRALRQRHRRPCLVIGMGPWTRPVYHGNPDVGRVISLSRHLPWVFDPAWWTAVNALRRSADLPIYVCEENRAHEAERLLRVAAVDRARCRTLKGDHHPGEHEIERILRVADGSIDHAPTVPAAAPNLVVLAEERLQRDEWLRERGWRDRPLVLIQPGNRRTMSSRRHRHRRLNRDDKAWPIGHWRQLLCTMHERMPRATLLLCGARAEAAFLEEIRRAAALERVSTAVLDLRSLFALFEIAHSMVSIDTGPAHAAAALGLPLVVMFGSQSPDRWLPRSPGTPVIRVGGPPAHQRVDQIPVQTVLESWWRLAGKPIQGPAVELADQSACSEDAGQAARSDAQALNTASTEI